jgi:hypothetical protein
MLAKHLRCLTMPVQVGRAWSPGRGERYDKTLAWHLMHEMTTRRMIDGNTTQLPQQPLAVWNTVQLSNVVRLQPGWYSYGRDTFTPCRKCRSDYLVNEPIRSECQCESQHIGSAVCLRHEQHIHLDAKLRPLCNCAAYCRKADDKSVTYYKGYVAGKNALAALNGGSFQMHGDHSIAGRIGRAVANVAQPCPKAASVY